MDADSIVKIIRAIPRPAVTIIFAVVIADGVICGRALPGWFLGLAVPIITWWFGEKFWKHKKELDNNGM